MGKKIFYVVLVLFIACGIYFFSPWAKEKRCSLWRFLNKDLIYLKRGYVVRGWIWEEQDDLVSGFTEDNAVFLFNRTDCQAIRHDEALRYMRELL